MGYGIRGLFVLDDLERRFGELDLLYFRLLEEREAVEVAHHDLSYRPPFLEATAASIRDLRSRSHGELLRGDIIEEHYRRHGMRRQRTIED